VEEPDEEAALDCDAVVLAVAVGNTRGRDRDAIRGRLKLQPRAGRLVAEQRFLDEEDTHLPGEMGHQVLRPLEHQVPTQVGEATEVASFAVWLNSAVLRFQMEHRSAGWGTEERLG
jgi:hypothetical protein